MAALQAYRLCIYTAEVTVVKKICFLRFQTSKLGNVNSLLQLVKAVIFSSCLPFLTITYSCMSEIWETSKQPFHVPIQNKHQKNFLFLQIPENEIDLLQNYCSLWACHFIFILLCLHLPFKQMWRWRGQSSKTYDSKGRQSLGILQKSSLRGTLLKEIP